MPGRPFSSWRPSPLEASTEVPGNSWELFHSITRALPASILSLIWKANTESWKVVADSDHCSGTAVIDTCGKFPNWLSHRAVLEWGTKRGRGWRMYFSYLFNYYFLDRWTISTRGTKWDFPRGHFWTYGRVERSGGLARFSILRKERLQ